MYPFGSCFTLDICQGVRLQGHMVTLVLVFLGTSILFSIVAVLIHIPTKSVGVFLFVYGHQNLLFVDFWTIAFLADMK